MAYRNRLEALPTAGLRVDISPMIDLVFLLLIFFMVASTLITYRKDKNVVIPLATDSVVPKLITNRTIINVYQDGTLKSEDGDTMSLEEVEATMAAAAARSSESRLHLRADRRAPHGLVKEVVQASARGGVTNVVYSTYQTDK